MRATDHARAFGARRLAAAVTFACVIVGSPTAAATSSGRLAPLGCINSPAGLFVDCGAQAAGLRRPVDVAVSGDGRHVYVADLAGAISWFRRASSGLLSFAGCVKSAGSTDLCRPVAAGLSEPHRLLLSSDGRYLYAASFHALALFRRNPISGRLTRLRCLSQVSANGTCQSVPGQTTGVADLVESPDGRNMYVLAGRRLFAFARDAHTGRLRKLGCLGSKSDRGCTRRAFGFRGGAVLAASSNGRNVYVATANEGRGVVLSLRRDLSGRLRFVSCLSEARIAGCQRVPLPLLANAIAASHDGRNIYLAFGGSETGTVTTLRTDRRRDGRLAPVDCISTSSSICLRTARVDDAQDIAISPDDANLYVAASGAFAVTTLRRTSGGRLVESQCIQDPLTGSASPPVYIRCSESASGLNRPVGIAVSPDGRSVYAVSDHFSQALVSFRRSLQSRSAVLR